jgi:hypothetical protein
MNKLTNKLLNVGITLEIGLIIFVVGSIYTNQDWLRYVLLSFL